MSYFPELENTADYRETLNAITGIRLSAQVVDARGARASADARLVAHRSPAHHHIRVSTSTTDARVGWLTIEFMSVLKY